MKTFVEYLSWSRLNAFEQGKYKSIYILGQKYQNKKMGFGKWIAELQEKDESSGVELIERVRDFLPTYPVREKEIRVEFKGIPLLAKPDGLNKAMTLCGETKTGVLWTQAMADKCDQITFYCLVIYARRHKLPLCELNSIETIVENDRVVATGRFKSFQTKRTLSDIMLMYGRVKKAWVGIQKIHKLAEQNL